MNLQPQYKARLQFLLRTIIVTERFNSPPSAYPTVLHRDLLRLLLIAAYKTRMLCRVMSWLVIAYVTNWCAALECPGYERFSSQHYIYHVLHWLDVADRIRFRLCVQAQHGWWIPGRSLPTSLQE